MVIGGLFDGYDVGIGVSQPLSFRGGAHALETIFEKLGSASEECGDTPERGRWALGLCAGVCQHRLAKNLVDDMGMRGGPCNRCSEHFLVVSHAVLWYALSI